MVEIVLRRDYKRDLKEKRPIEVPAQTIRSLSTTKDGRVRETVASTPKIVIPPMNTDITFSSVLQTPSKATLQRLFGSSLGSSTSQPLQENFDWKTDGGALAPLIADPPDQRLCGSCWAIAAADIIGDLYVVSGVIDYKPNLSTTYCLSCYPQGQCNGGNPGLLYSDITSSGILSKHCIDYSWCDQNGSCSGSGVDHFSTGGLNSLIPNCGCYQNRSDHLRYGIRQPATIDIQAFGGDANYLQFRESVKRHIRTKGPVMGGFLVFANFMSGGFTRVNNGVYLETGVYNGDSIYFSPNEISEARYTGSHAVAIIGWGVARDTVINNRGETADVPYWYCRNSWSTYWGDGGYFKMAMWPFNQLSQFDQTVSIRSSTPSGTYIYVAGGIVIADAGPPPVLVHMNQVDPVYLSQPLNHSPEFYSQDWAAEVEPDEPPDVSPTPVDPPQDPLPTDIDPPEQNEEPPSSDPPAEDVETKRSGVNYRVLLVLGLLLATLLIVYFLVRKYRPDLLALFGV